MTQGISGWRRDDWDRAVENDPGPSVVPPSELAHEAWSDYPIPLLPQPLPATALPAVVAPPATQPGRDAQIRTNLDAFRMAMNAPYRTPEGTAWPGTPFRMVPLPPNVEVIDPQTSAERNQAIASGHLSSTQRIDVASGRGSPEAIHAVTQALIDQGRLPPASEGDLDSRVRIMMFHYRIGIDCAGYVQQAYLRVMRIDAATAGFKLRDEDLSNLGARGFTRIAHLASVRPGDLVALGPPATVPPVRGEPGHRAIVYEQHLASPAELDALVSRGSAGASLVRNGPVRVFQLDSSWGSSGDPLLGGVRRETWWYSEKSATWAWSLMGVDGPGSLRTAPTPGAHPFGPPFGIFRGNPAR
jgi:hypothetical protein